MPMIIGTERGIRIKKGQSERKKVTKTHRIDGFAGEIMLFFATQFFLFNSLC